MTGFYYSEGKVRSSRTGLEKKTSKQEEEEQQESRLKVYVYQNIANKATHETKNKK